MTTLTQLSETQAQKATTVNENFGAVSPAGLFGYRAAGSSALTWAYYGGILVVDGTQTAISDGSISLTNAATNYIEATRAGAVSSNTTGFTAGRIPLYTATTSGSVVTSYTDYRELLARAVATLVSVAVTSADVTLSAAQARAEVIETTGVLTGNRSVIVPAVPWIYVVNNKNTGSFTTTVKTNAGTGPSVPQGMRALLYCDGTDVHLVATFTIAGAPNEQSGATYTVLISDATVINNGGATLTLTLPTPAISVGRRLRVVSYVAFTTVSAGSNVVPQAGGAAGTAILAATAGKWADLECDGTNWRITASN